MSSAILYNFESEYPEEELADLLLIWLWRHASHMIMVSKSRDTVKMAVTLSIWLWLRVQITTVLDGQARGRTLDLKYLL